MITRASFRNFKSLREVDVTFDSRLTVLVGPNGSGKSSILQGIHYLSQLAGGKPAYELFTGPRDPRNLHARNPHGDIELEFVYGKHDPTSYRMCLDSSPDSEHDSEPGWRPVSAWSKDGGLTWQGRDDPPPPGLRAAQSAVLLKLDADQLAAPSVQDRLRPRMAYDGDGMGSVLAYLALNAPEDFLRLQDTLRRIIPSVERLRFDRVALTRYETETVTIDQQALRRQVARQHWGEQVLFDFKGAPGVPAGQASEGTLLVLGLLTIFLGPGCPRTVLFDDLDHGLHPKAQMELVGTLRHLLERNPDLQIIATSHSPYILSRLEWNEVRVTALKDDGSAVCVPLTAHPDVDRWKEAMTPGEFWSHLGDEWVTKLDRRQAATPAAAP